MLTTALITSVTAILTAIITWIFSPLLTHYLNRKKPLQTTPLLEHPFFWEVKYMMSITIPKLCIPGSKLKTLMLRKFLLIKFNTILIYYQELSNKISSNKPFCKKEYIDIITNIVIAYENESINEEIPEIFVRKFSEWHTQKIMILQDLILFITHADVYNSDTEKLSAILSSILMTLHFTLMDAVEVVNMMNGELEKKLK